MALVINQSIQTIRFDRYTKGANKGKPVTRTPQGILLHSDEGTRAGSIPWLTTAPTSQVSCHFYVCRNGDVYQFAPDEYRTWHGGVGDWDGVANLNDLIGIECEHTKGQDWPVVQLQALADLCKMLIGRHQFPPSRIAAHRWGAKPTGRKQDPTNWSDQAIRAWIAALYQPVVGGLTFLHAPPRISRDLFRRVLEVGTRFGPSPAASIADDLYDICGDVGVDPALALAFAAHEHEYMTNPDSLTVKHKLNNWGNTRSAYDPSRATLIPIPGRGTFARYPDYQTSIRDWCERMRYWYAAGKVPGYAGRIMATAESAIPVYAPSNDGNAPQKYIDHVKRLVAQWEAESMATTTGWGRDDYNQGWGIESRWERDGKTLGQAVSAEVPVGDDYAVRAFERGVIAYRRSDGATATGEWTP